MQQQPSPNRRFKILEGDAQLQLAFIKSESIDTVFTSPEPPYSYDQLLKLEAIMLELPRVLKPTGSIWINMSDIHNEDGVLTIIPERFLYDMVVGYQWKLRNNIVWSRASDTWDKSDMRRFRRDHEYCYWFVKDVEQHYFPLDRALNITPRDLIETHYVPPEPGEFESGFPIELIELTAIRTTPHYGRILDPFCGTATTGIAALRHDMEFLGIEANPLLIPKIHKRLNHELTRSKPHVESSD